MKWFFSDLDRSKQNQVNLARSSRHQSLTSFMSLWRCTELTSPPTGFWCSRSWCLRNIQSISCCKVCKRCIHCSALLSRWLLKTRSNTDMEVMGLEWELNDSSRGVIYSITNTSTWQRLLTLRILTTRTQHAQSSLVKPIAKISAKEMTKKRASFLHPDEKLECQMDYKSLNYDSFSEFFSHMTDCYEYIFKKKIIMKKKW